jgi:hypothetical protein
MWDRLRTLARQQYEQLSWRTATAAVFLLLTGFVWLGSGSLAPRRPVPAVHRNFDAGFAIRPPRGWTQRTDDVDGTQIAPQQQPVEGFRTLVVSTRLASHPDPKRHLAEMAARPAAGPIRDLKWIRQEPARLSDGTPAALGEFSETYRGAKVHGWVVFTVVQARLLQAVLVLPEAEADAREPEMIEALRTLEAL